MCKAKELTAKETLACERGGTYADEPILCAKCSDHITAGEQGAICEVCASTQESAITGLQGDIEELRNAAIVWHKYPEEKPKPNTRHLVVVNGNVHISRYDAEQDIDKINVTHWAYLPAPPKEEK